MRGFSVGFRGVGLYSFLESGSVVGRVEGRSEGGREGVDRFGGGYA